MTTRPTWTEGPPGTERTLSVETTGEAATIEAAARLARDLRGGSVVLLVGALGAGKTRFAKGLARGLGLDPEAVVSPTFTLVHEHAPAAPGGLGLVHVDLYRIERPSDLEGLGLDELPGAAAVAAVEWPERLAGGEAQGCVEVTIDDLGGERRKLTARVPRGGPPPGVIWRRPAG